MKNASIVSSRRLGFILSIALAALVAAPASAETSFGVRSGVYTDETDGFVGAEALAGIGSSWYFNPNFEYAFVDRGDLVTVNGDFHYDLVEGRPYYFWVGGGPAVIFRDMDAGGGSSDLGLNFLAGIGFKGASMTPYVQSKVTVAEDDDQFVLAFGLRF